MSAIHNRKWFIECQFLSAKNTISRSKLERLNIRVVQKIPEKEPPAAAKEDQNSILKGLPARADFEAFVRDFEESPPRSIPFWISINFNFPP